MNHDGYLVGLDNMKRILRSGDKFYISVPIGPQRTEFNAHRVFSVEYLIGLFAEGYRLDRFSYVDDAGDLQKNVPLDPAFVRTDCGCDFGCGILEITKL